MNQNQEYLSRKGRIVAAMAEAGLDALLLHSPAWRKDNVRYASNFSFLGPYADVVIDRDGNASLFISACSDLERARNESWIEDIQVAGANPVSSLTARLGQLGSSIQLGIAGMDFAGAGVINGLRDRLPGAELVSAAKLYENVRAIKSPAEIEIVRQAANIADTGFKAFVENIAAGKKEYELIADVERVVKAAGADDNFMLVACGGSEVTGMTPARNRTIERGHMLRTEVSPCYKGYYIQICRSVVFGKPTAEQLRQADIFLRAYEAAVAILKPGVTGHELARVQNAVFEAEGFGEYMSVKYTRTRGHGHGMYLDEPPTLEEGNNAVVQPGMVIIPHPNTFLPIAGYMVLGDPVVVTENGCEILTKTERKLFSVE